LLVNSTKEKQTIIVLIFMVVHHKLLEDSAYIPWKAMDMRVLG
jgi:hypothetical protein